MVSGMSNPQAYTSNEERVEFYRDFLDCNASVTEVRHYVNQDTLIAGFNGFVEQDIPFLILYDNVENIYYDLNCFEDISEEIVSINNLQFEELVKASKERISWTYKYLNQTVNDERLTPNFSPSPNKRFEVYFIGGIFLGNKIKKRVLPMCNINNLKSVQFVEISMVAEDK